jgi:hypothetical protein
MRLSFRHLTGGVVGALLLPLASAIPAQAVLVNVGSTTYDVSFITTSQSLSSALFAATAPGQMPWWGDLGLASTFADQVYDQLGLNLYQADYGAVFAYDYNPGGLGEVYGIVQNTSDTSSQLDLDSTSPLAAANPYPYAIATAASTTAVPVPLPLLGAAAAFGWARRLRINRKLINSKRSRMNQDPGLSLSRRIP